MTDFNILFTLISFYFVMYVTPGPNNAMVLASGLRFGFSKTIPHMSGITIGHVLQLTLVCLGLGKIFQIYPSIQSILKIICAIYLVYLGYKIIGSIKCSQGGHSLTNKLLRKVFAEKSNFSVFEIKEKTLPHTYIDKSVLKSIA